MTVSATDLRAVAGCAAQAALAATELRLEELEEGLFFAAPTAAFAASADALARDGALWECCLVAVESGSALPPAAWRAAAAETDFLAEVLTVDGRQVAVDGLYEDELEELRGRADQVWRVWLVCDDQEQDSAVYPLLWLRPQARGRLSELDHDLGRHLAEQSASGQEGAFLYRALESERHQAFHARLREERVLDPVRAESRGRVSGLGG